jgi:hypothetical protein
MILWQMIPILTSSTLLKSRHLNLALNTAKKHVANSQYVCYRFLCLTVLLQELGK